MFIFLFIPVGVLLAGHVASQGCTERITSTKQVTSHLCHSQTASAQHLHVFQSHGRKRWPVMTPLHYTCSQDQERTLSHHLFPLWGRKTIHIYSLSPSWRGTAQAAFLGCLCFLPKLSPHMPPGLIFVQRRSLYLCTVCTVCTPKQTQLHPWQSSLLQQNHQGFVFTSAVQTWCKRKQSSLSPALNLSFLPMSALLKKALMKMSNPNLLDWGRAFKWEVAIEPRTSDVFCLKKAAVATTLL